MTTTTTRPQIRHPPWTASFGPPAGRNWSPRLAAMAQGGHEPTLANYLHHTGLALDDVYSNNRSWSDLPQAAGLPVAPAGPEEVSLRRAIGRQLHIDDLERISTFRHFLVQPVRRGRRVPARPRCCACWSSRWRAGTSRTRTRPRGRTGCGSTRRWTLAPVIDSVYPVYDVAEAFRRFGAQQHTGKIVISITPDEQG